MVEDKDINFTFNGVKLHKVLPKGSTRFVFGTPEQISKMYLGMISQSNEAMDDDGYEWRHCSRCGAWKPLGEISPACYPSYPAQYECKRCDDVPEVVSTGKIKIYRPKDTVNVVSQVKNKVSDKQGVIYIPYKGRK